MIAVGRRRSEFIITPLPSQAEAFILDAVGYFIAFGIGFAVCFFIKPDAISKRAMKLKTRTRFEYRPAIRFAQASADKQRSRMRRFILFAEMLGRECGKYPPYRLPSLTEMEQATGTTRRAFAPYLETLKKSEPPVIDVGQGGTYWIMNYADRRAVVSDLPYPSRPLRVFPFARGVRNSRTTPEQPVTSGNIAEQAEITATRLEDSLPEIPAWNVRVMPAG